MTREKLEEFRQKKIAEKSKKERVEEMEVFLEKLSDFGEIYFSNDTLGKQMTREEILAMKPGRELDKLVAEKVFNWRKVPGPKTDYDGPCESFDVLVPPTIADPFPLYPPKGVIKPWYFCEYWSTDITAAWKVEQEIKNRKIISKYVIALMEVVGVENRCPFSDIEMFSIIHASPADRCKAALLAVLEEGDK